MKYEELIEALKYPQPNYYALLLQNAEEILRAYRTRNQHQLGLDLGLHQAQISLLLKMLTAYSEIHILKTVDPDNISVNLPTEE